MPSSFNGIDITPRSVVLFYSKAGSGKKYGRQRVGIVTKVGPHTLTVNTRCENDFDEIYFKVPVGATTEIQIRKVRHAYVGVEPFSHVIVVPEGAIDLMGLRDEVNSLGV